MLRLELTYSDGSASYRIGMVHHCSHCHLSQSMYIQTHLDHGVVGLWSRGWGGSNCSGPQSGPQSGAQSTFLSRSWYQWCCQLLCLATLGRACTTIFIQTILRRCSGRDPSVLHLMRCFFFYLAHFNFQHSAEHVPGVLNTSADAISRNNLPQFCPLFSHRPPRPGSQSHWWSCW